MKSYVNNIPKSSISRTFSKVALRYDEFATLQIEIAARLLDRLEFIKINPCTILDLGSGTGIITAKLRQKFANAVVFGVDMALGMVKFARATTQQSNIHYICNDAEKLALTTNAIDLIFSNCTLQWSQNLPDLFVEVHRVLKPGGIFLFSTFGPDTLFELSKVWQEIDDYQHVNNFLDMHHIGDLLLINKFQEPVVDQEKIVLTYTNLVNLFKDLKGMGANNLPSNKFKGLYTKNTMQQLAHIYKQNYCNAYGMLAATFEVIYGIAWKAPAKNNSLLTAIRISGGDPN